MSQRRARLRSRVLLLTGAFALALFTITFGLSWRARLAQEKWARLIGVETAAIARLQEVIRAQNAFRAHHVAGDGPRYQVVAQLLQDPALERIDASMLRARVRAFQSILDDPEARPEDVDAASLRVTEEARRVIDSRKSEIGRQLPALERDSREMMSSGLAIAWIVVLVSFAVVQVALRKVVRPLEELASAAEKIASGDLTARAPIAGDYEIAKLGGAFNRMADELKARARTDELTSLPNFRAFRERIEGEIERAARYPECFGVLVLDLDRFKNYNDTYGHAAGNDALQRVSRVIRETVRSVDFPARYGGEEFAVIVPQIDAAALTVIAERIRANIEALPAPAGGATLTASIGAAMYPLDGDAAQALFQAADARLYQAKEAGRNRVVAPTAVKVPDPRSAGRQSA
ncbi:MAG: diguanylate cyclase [Acidobacteria bacterium]|nr:diguanylate cyclase [Acidobacteriota bacterium]